MLKSSPLDPVEHLTAIKFTADAHEAFCYVTGGIIGAMLTNLSPKNRSSGISAQFVVLSPSVASFSMLSEFSLLSTVSGVNSGVSLSLGDECETGE